SARPIRFSTVLRSDSARRLDRRAHGREVLPLAIAELALVDVDGRRAIDAERLTEQRVRGDGLRMAIAAQALRELVDVESGLRRVTREDIDRCSPAVRPLVLAGEHAVVILPEFVLVERAARGACGEERMRVDRRDRIVVVRVAD